MAEATYVTDIVERTRLEILFAIKERIGELTRDAEAPVQLQKVIIRDGGSSHRDSVRYFEVNNLYVDENNCLCGDLVCKGAVGSRTGIDQKGGNIIVGGDTGAFTGFMMQRGRMVILGDAGANLGDSMYDGTIYVGGKIASLGVDAVPGEMTDLDVQWLKRKLAIYGLEAPKGIENMTKIVAGKQLWNYDNLEPTEKKLIL